MPQMPFTKQAPQADVQGVIVASGWPTKNGGIRMVFQSSITDSKGKRMNLTDGIKFMPNEALLISAVKNKKSDRSPEYVGICFPEASAVPEKKEA